MITAFLLAALALISGSRESLAQSSRCAEARRQTTYLGREWGIETRSLVLLDDGLLLFGQGAFHAEYRGDSVVRVDTSIAGILLRGDGSPRGIPRPRPGMSLADASTARIDGREARVIFRVGADDSENPRSEFELWTARLKEMRWEGVEPIGTFHSPSTVSPDFVAGIVEYDGAHLFAFVQEDSASRNIVVVRTLGARISVDTFPTAFASLDHVSLAVHAGKLWVAARGAIPPHEGFHDLWVAELAEGSSLQFRRVALGRTRMLDQPRLIPSDEGLVLAWITEAGGGEPSLLSWRGASELDAIEHALPARWPIMRGNPPFEWLLAAPQEGSSEALILRLTPDRAVPVARVPNSTFYPVLGGYGSRLYAVSIEVDSARARSARVAVSDLGCALSTKATRRE